MKWFVPLLVILSLLACNNKKESIIKMQEQIEIQNVLVKDLESRVNSLEMDSGLLKSLSETYNKATFDPAETSGYSRIDTTAGIFLVSLENVTPYVDGYRVKMKFGNITSATFNGFALNVKWGSRWDYKKTPYSVWEKSLSEKRISFTNKLYPGTWNIVTFVVAPAKSNEFGYIEITIETNIISLKE